MAAVISVVVPVLNEEDNIAPLVREIAAAAQSAPISEIIYVDDGSTDGTLQALRVLKAEYPMLRVIRHAMRSGQSAGLWTGVKAAGNDIIVTLDGDGQNDPADIALLYRKYLENKDRTPRLMVAGQRKKRNDNFSRRLASRLANGLRSWMLRDNTRDTGCSLKLFLRRDYLGLPYFNHMHRFLPALMIRDSVRVLHVDVSHRPRERGVSKYNNLNRALVGVSDLLGVRWLQSRCNTFPKTTEELP
jgi:dolichol-phosphate mannosyltransferase